MVYCINCGTHLREKDKFCHTCGKKTNFDSKTKSNISSPAPQKRDAAPHDAESRIKLDQIEFIFKSSPESMIKYFVDELNRIEADKVIVVTASKWLEELSPDQLKKGLDFL